MAVIDTKVEKKKKKKATAEEKPVEEKGKDTKVEKEEEEKTAWEEKTEDTNPNAEPLGIETPEEDATK